MGYDTKELKKLAIEVIFKNKLVFIEDVAVFMGISKPTFYEHGLNEVNEIKDLIRENKVKMKSSLRVKWYKSDKPVLQLALYKLLGTLDEVHRLNGSRQEITTKEEIKSMTKEELLNKIGQIKLLMGENKKSKKKEKIICGKK